MSSKLYLLINKLLLIMDISKKIRELMLRDNINGNDLAQRIGSSRQYISQVLSGKGDLRVSTLEKIAKGFNVPLAALMEDKNTSVMTSKAMTKKVIFQIEVDESVDDNYLKMVIGKDFINQLKK